MAGMLQFASDWYHRLASSGYVPRSFFKPDPPNLADLPRRRGRLTLEIVSHCWKYSHLLAYQLSSLVLYPPQKILVKMTVFHNEADLQTVELLRYFSRQGTPNVQWRWWPIERERLPRRSIGRNLACSATTADWIWLTDCDQLFQPGCLDALAGELSGRNDPLVFPRVAQCTEPLDETDELLLASSGSPQLVSLGEVPLISVTHHKAIGGLQIVHGDVARELGYCRDIPYYQSPATNWQNTTDDGMFRRLLGSHGLAIDVPGLVRIEHARKGRHVLTENSTWLQRAAQPFKQALAERRIRQVQSIRRRAA